MGRHPVTLTDPLSLDPLSLAWLDWMAAARIPAHTVARRRAVLRSIGNAGAANAALFAVAMLANENAGLLEKLAAYRAAQTAAARAMTQDLK